MDTQPESHPRWLTELFAPVPIEEFLSRYWLKSHLLCPGHSEKFSALLSWTVLNEILEHHWRETYRFRLVQSGRDLDVDSYSERGNSNWPKIRSKELIEQLQRGATLVFEAIDEVHQPLRRLAESFELFFGSGTNINIYAGWRNLHGLDLHSDNHEIFILQVAGHKRWLLYGFSVEGLDRSELKRSSVPPEGAILDQVIKPGDLLYIPRGCYHLAVPLDEPALHLTVSLKSPRGIDLLLWIAEQLRTTEIGMRDVARFAASSERTSFNEELRNTFLMGLGPDVLERFYSERSATFKPRPSLSLPWSATHEGLPPGTDFLVRLTVRHRLLVSVDASTGAIEFSCLGRNWRFPGSMKSLLDQLNQDVALSMSQLVQSAAGRLDEEAIRTLVAMLVKQGLAAIEI